MEKIFVKKLGTCIENNEANRPLLIKLGYIKTANDVKNNKKPSKHANIDIVRTSESIDTE